MSFIQAQLEGLHISIIKFARVDMLFSMCLMSINCLQSSKCDLWVLQYLQGDGEL